jgi:hypothetical protein
MALNKDVFVSYEKAAQAAASLRGALRGEPYPISVTATSKTYTVPPEWKGALVRIQAEAVDVYYVISTDGTQAVCDKAAVCTEGGAGPYTLTAPAQGCGRIFASQWLDVPFPSTATTFALQGSAAGVARCHLAET